MDQEATAAQPHTHPTGSEPRAPLFTLPPEAQLSPLDLSTVSSPEPRVPGARSRDHIRDHNASSGQPGGQQPLASQFPERDKRGK